MKNDSGFSLVQVLIAFSLTSVLALQMFRMNSYQIKTSQNAELAVDISLIMNQMALYLSNSSSCTSTFRGIFPANAYTFPEGEGIKNRDGSTVFSVGSKYARGKLLIKSIEVVPDANDPVLPPSDVFGVVKVFVTLQKLNGKGTTLTTKEVRRELLVQVLVDPTSGETTQCYNLKDESIASIRITTCEQDLGGMWNSNLGRCVNATLGGDGTGSMCGTCQYTETSSAQSHRELHQTGRPGLLRRIHQRWYHGWRNRPQNNSSAGTNTDSPTYGVTCVTNLRCKGEDICRTGANNASCTETCPPGYSLQTIYEDYDTTDISVTEAMRSTIKLKSCIKNE